jgi:hypothetical protein
MNNQQTRNYILKSKLLSRIRDKKVITPLTIQHSSCPSCQKKKTEQNINRVFRKKQRG